MATVGNDGLFQVGDEVTGSFRCAECDLLVSSPRESDGVLVLPPCPLCGSEEWREVREPGARELRAPASPGSRSAPPR